MTVSGGAPPTEGQRMAELRAARASGRRLPDFFIVGHAKCGTTALFEMLRVHPQIFLPALKELQFLAREADHRDPKPSRRRPRLRPRTLEEYLELFEGVPPEQRAGEATTSYLRTPSAAGRIAALAPEALIVAMFREPASFLRSLHLQLLQVGVETEPDFATALALQQPRSEGRQIPRGCPWPAALQYTAHTRYADQLRQYHGLFGRERVKVLIYDDFRSDNLRGVREVLRFLEVDDTFEIAPTEANPTVRMRSKRAHDLLHDITVGRGPVLHAMKGAVKTVTPRRLRHEALQSVTRKVVEDDPRAPDDELMADLRRSLKGEVVAASEYLERDLVGLWGYEEVD